MGIHRSSLSRIICKDLHLKCFKRRRAQELTDANCAACMKRAKLLIQKFPQYVTDFVFFTDKRCSRSLHLTVGRTKSVTDCGNFWRSLAFSSLQCGHWPSAAAWPPVINCACAPQRLQLFEQLINTTLCPAFLMKFVCQPLCCVPLQIHTFYQNLPSSCWLLTYTAMMSAGTNFRCHKLIAKVNK